MLGSSGSDPPSLLSGFEGSVWSDYLASEPDPQRISDPNADPGIVALGRFGDLKSLYTLTHSQRVSMIAEAAGRAAGPAPHAAGPLGC